jgi:CrcB protein
MLIYLWVALGGALGTIARYALNGVISQRFGQTFPLGTMVINITGSFIIGVFAQLTAPEGRWLVSPTFRVFFMVGICGGYTTFSSFSLQTLSLARDEEWLYASLNILLSVALGLTAVYLGHVLAMKLSSTKVL